MKTYFAKYTAVLSVLTLVLTPLSASVPTVTAATAHVGMYDNYYSPQTITVNIGDTVTWTNHGSMPHTVTSDTGLFNSGNIGPQSAYSVTFPVAGTFRYYCQLHGGPNGVGMSGMVIVQSGGTTPPNSSTNSLTATVTQSGPGPITINSITPVKTAGTANNTFESGWKWIFDISIPQNEPNVAMRFDNWLMQNSSNIIPIANNLRFYSLQSSNANTANNAIYITSPGNWSNWMFLNGDLDSSPSVRRVQITVEGRIPNGSATGTYTTNFGIRTQ